MRRATSLSLDSALIDEAKAYGINLSRAAEAGLLEEVRRARAEAWKSENRAAMEETNTWVAEHGLPLARYRQF